MFINLSITIIIASIAIIIVPWNSFYTRILFAPINTKNPARSYTLTNTTNGLFAKVLLIYSPIAIVIVSITAGITISRNSWSAGIGDCTIITGQ